MDLIWFCEDCGRGWTKDELLPFPPISKIMTCDGERANGICPECGGLCGNGHDATDFDHDYTSPNY